MACLPRGSSSMNVFAAGPDRAAAGLVDLAQLFLGIQDLAGRGEVGPLDVLEQVLHVDLRVVDHGGEAVHDLAEVVRREGAAHADGDARGAVHEQLRKARGQHDGLLERVVVVRPEGDRVLLDLDEQFLGKLRQAGLRCTAWPPPGRRRGCRSCPILRRAGSGARSPGPCGPWRRRPPGRRGDGTCRAPRRPRPRSSGTWRWARGPSPTWHRGSCGARA